MDSQKITNILSQDDFTKELVKLLPLNKVEQVNNIENVVIQPNNISKAVYNCNVTTQKLFTYLIKMFKAEKRSGKNRVFEFVSADLKNKLKLTNVTQVKTALQNLKDLSIFIETDKVYKYYSLVDYFEFDKQKNSVSIELGVRFSELLEKKITGNFTALDFDLIVDLPNFYSIRYYEIAMSWRGLKGRYRKPKSSWYEENIKDYKNSWFFGYSIEQFRVILDIQDKYTDVRDFLKKVIYTPIEILNQTLLNYKFIPQIIRDSDKQRLDKSTGELVNFGKVKGIIIWIVEKKENMVEYVPTDSYQVIEEKRELNEDAQEYDRAMLLKEKYPKEWTEQEIISRDKLTKLYGATTMQVLVDMDVYKELKEKLSL